MPGTNAGTNACATTRSRMPLPRTIEFGRIGDRLFQSIDGLLFAVFIPVQWRITVLLLRASRRRLSGTVLNLAYGAIFLFDAVVAVGYSFTFSSFLSHFHIPPHTA